MLNRNVMCVFHPYGVCLQIEAGRYLNNLAIICHLNVNCKKSECKKFRGI